MKALYTLRTLSSTLALLFVVASATSCKKEVIEPAGSSSNTPLVAATPGKYNSEVSLVDGNNIVKLLVTSDNKTAIEAFRATASLKAVTGSEESGEAINTFAESSDSPDEANAIHISLIESNLASGYESFEINTGDAQGSADASNYSSFNGPYYFYSFDAPHSFKVTPSAGNCVSAWLYEKETSWVPVSWAGGNGGNYVCNLTWSANSSATNLDFKLKTQGSNISVSWN